MNVPKAVATEWLCDLIDMVITAQSNEFQVRRIEREALAFLSKGRERPEICWLVLAFTAFLRGDRDECVRCSEAAQALARHDVTILTNVASLMCDLGEPRMAVNYARLLADTQRSDPTSRIKAAHVFVTALHAEEAAAVMLAHDLNATVAEGDAELPRDIEATAQIFLRCGVDAEQRLALLETAVEAIRSQGCMIRGSRLMIYDDTTRYELYVDETASQCGNVNFAIAEALTTTFDNAYPEVITFVCRPVGSLSALASRSALMEVVQ
ncbi:MULTISPECIES: hypothetical protein [unclassified Caballeronia]|uniref:hypothetical protein n=1 Tax=unclassified Caballeronia TaxID=2646786 RepID=UPI0028542072|nr:MULTISPECIES: hypothetical protein [unclassified Caballeronia]MDR5772892.1 hypothetical protein [Caballeronia sp. LZ002]MDR5848326.1 hypothetical protein [Caballeronia sp. LZ003]